MYCDIKSDDYWKQLNDYVSEKHKDQMYGDKNYMYHINMVVGLMAQYVPVDTVAGLELVTGAYCHDLMEDQNVTFKELEDRYGKRVAQLVSAVSGFGNTRAERTADTLEKLEIYPDAVNIKIVDRCCNMICARNSGKEKLMEMYFKEAPKYEEVFKKALPEFQELLANELKEYALFFENKKSIKLK